jgi:acetyl esterase/lipase
LLHETIDIDIDYKALGLAHDDTKATLTTYIRDVFPNDQKPFRRPLVIICPGGGYHHHSPREGEPVALKLLELGCNAVILRYSLMPNEFPCALYELAWTVNYVRTRCTCADESGKRWDTDPNKIIAAGFSAGGHVAGSLGTMYAQPELEAFLKYMNISAQAVKPDGLLLGYSVLTSGVHAHKASFERLLGTRYADSKLLSSVDLVTRVTKDTPPTFLWHTVTDGSVPVENSLMFARALQENGVSFELHIFPEGHHGLALGTKETDTIDGTHFQPEVNVWTDLFSTWMERFENKGNI